MEIKKIYLFLFLFVVKSAFVVAQNGDDYNPMHVGDYHILKADTTIGQHQATTYRSDVLGIDLINGKAHFCIREQVGRDDGTFGWTSYSWIYIDSTGFFMGALGESSEIILDIPIPTVPTNTITADGNTADWAGIDTLTADPQGDDTPGQTGDDLKAVFVAKDSFYLYLRMDLWETVNTNFRNGPSPYQGRYTFRVDNDGPYSNADFYIVYDADSLSWIMGAPGDDDPPVVLGPDDIGVSGSVIELRVSISQMGSPTNFTAIGGMAEYYDPAADRVLSWDEATVAETSIFDQPITWMPSDMQNVGDTWEFDSYEMGGHFSISIESDSQTIQVPAGTFPGCVELKMVVTDTNGDTTQVNRQFYAENIGVVLNIMSNEWMGEELRLELIDYSVQGSNVNTYTNPTTPTVGSSLSIVGTVPQQYGATTRQLFYRMVGQSTFQTTDLTPTGNVYEASIPTNFISIRGIEYYVRFSDDQTVKTYPALDPANHPTILQIKVNQYTPSITFNEMVYRMISVPLELTNPSISAVLSDDYGEYRKSIWRLCVYEENDSSYYIEYPNFQKTFTPGSAFWLITRSGETFDVENGWSVDTSEPYTFTLEPGWNQGANPFAFPVAWSSVTHTADVEAPVYYDSDVQDYVYDVSVCNPWEGYFFYNSGTAPTTITVYPVETTGPPKKFNPKRMVTHENDYVLQLSVGVPGFKVIDTQNYLGLLRNASAGFEDEDIPEAPPIGDYVRLSVIEDGVRFAGNFKPLNEEGQEWKLELDSSLPFESTVQIGLIQTGQLPAGMELYVFDVDDQYRLSANEGSFEIRLGKGSIRHLHIIIGSKEFAEEHSDGISLVPLEFTLYQNYPNPFNPQTTITYRIGKRGLVTLEIFDILGRRIRTLVDENQSPGTYSVPWNGLDNSGQFVAAGVYISRLTASEFKDSKKLILVH